MGPVVCVSFPRALAAAIVKPYYYTHHHRLLCPNLLKDGRYAYIVGGGYRCKSTTTSSVVSSVEGGGKDSADVSKSSTSNKAYKKDKLDLTFYDHEAAFRSKTNTEVLRAIIVFQLCSIKTLVVNNEVLLKFGQKVLGKRLFGSLMKATFYGHFVAGEDQILIQPTLERLRSFGVKSILDYSVEEDISSETAEEREMESLVPAAERHQPEDIEQERACETKADGTPHEPKSDGTPKLHRYTPQRKFADRRMQVSGARTYFYVSEAQCEKNMETFIACIDAVSDATHGTGFAAIKLTALGRPQLLMQLSEVIARARTYFAQVTGKTAPIIAANVDKNVFAKRFKEENVNVEEPAIQNWMEKITADKKGLIHLFSWSGLIDANMLLKEVFQVPSLKSGQMEPIISALTREEEEMFKNMMRRIHTIFKYAKERDVRVMVDAEQTYFQPAISRLTMEMMKKYNTEKAIVFNTYQCYLKDTYGNLFLDLEQCHRQSFYFGAKLVRGAYMEQERARAEELGYEDPVNPNYEATTDMYHNCLLEVLRQIKRHKAEGDPSKVAVMVASHNEGTVTFTVKKMAEFDINPLDRVICFGQLLGMCDHISLPLGQAGYSVYKYVPYGPVNDVLPYLSRRATENSSILVKLNKEKKMLRRELFRRIASGQLVYTPKGDYIPLGASGVSRES